VSECETGGGRRRRRKADTELKTKTPHVNVGKNSSSSGNYLKQSLSECELTLWATVWTVIIGLDLGLRVWDMVVFKDGPSVLS
jgi:hypothetical protein